MIAIDPAQGCCACVSSHLSELLDGELDEGAAPRVAMHVATCAACARVARELAEIVAAIHTAPLRPPHPGPRPPPPVRQSRR
jgi:anti-sigma factor RsiW